MQPKCKLPCPISLVCLGSGLEVSRFRRCTHCFSWSVSLVPPGEPPAPSVRFVYAQPGCLTWEWKEKRVNGFCHKCGTVRLLWASPFYNSLSCINDE